MKDSIWNKGGFLVFLGALFWSLNAPLVVFLDLDPMLMCGLRSLIAAAVLLPFLRPRKIVWNLWTIVYLASFAALCMSLIISLKMVSAAVAIGMQYTAAVWIFLVHVLRGGKVTPQSAIPIGMIFLGVVIFMSTGATTGEWKGITIALLEGVFFAVMSVSSKKTVGENPLGLTGLANLATGLLVFFFLPPKFGDLAALSSSDWIIMLILGTVQTGLGYSFYNMGVAKTTPQKASIIALWEMILGPLWVAIFLKEYPSLTVLIGFVVILIGMFLHSGFQLLDAKMVNEK